MNKLDARDRRRARKVWPVVVRLCPCTMCAYRRAIKRGAKVSA